MKKVLFVVVYHNFKNVRKNPTITRYISDDPKFFCYSSTNRDR